MSTSLLAILLSMLVSDNQAQFDVDPFSAATDVLKFTFDEREDLEHDFQPDDWTRRHGPGFPFFVDARIVADHGHIETDEEADDHSLYVGVNGGHFAIYSPFQNAEGHIDPAFNYVFRGYVRTEKLVNDAAVLSISFLNARRQRLQRFVTKPVTGTHRDWVRLEIGPVEPHPDAMFIVIGCHVVHDEQQDISGHVWFDDLWLGKLPRLKLLNTVRTRYLTPNDPILIDALVSGLEVGSLFTLKQSISDVFGNEIDRGSWPLELKDSPDIRSEDRTRPIQWKLDPQERGCYLLRTHLERDGKLMLLTETAIAVLDPAKPQPGGEFGWSVPKGIGYLSTDELAFVAGEAGINWIKLPLWKSLHDGGELTPAETAELLEKLSDRSIAVVGMLADPPDNIRAQFARNWSGVSEIFVLPSEIWLPTVEPVLARYGSAVDRWQLGGDNDFSFMGVSSIGRKVATVKRQFDRIGRNSQLGIQWPYPSVEPPPTDIRDLFITITPTEETQEIELKHDPGSKDTRTQHWLLLNSGSPELSLNDRAVNLVRKMLDARLAGVDGIFLADVFDPRRGLIRPDGAPDPLFLPWRTTALTLRGAEHLGSFQLQEDIENHIFTRDGEALVVFSSKEATNLDFNLGDSVEAVDIWGRRTRVAREDGRHQLKIDHVPVFCTGCSEPLAHWRLKVGFENSRIPSEFGGHPEAILGVNTFNQTIRGEIRLRLPRDWEAAPNHWEVTLAPNEAFRLPTTLKLPQNASLGEADATIEFDITADVRRHFKVYRTFEVGLGDVIVEVVERVLPNGDLAIDQIVTNATSPPETLNFKCNLSVTGHKTRTQYILGLSPGKDRCTYPLQTNAEALRGQELWLNLEQLNGRRNLNKRLIIGESQASEESQKEAPEPDSTTAARPEAATVR
ncbi:hypothetical protein GC176_23570 [bacterium]|nr:hypothetical protein [bacterium]